MSVAQTSLWAYQDLTKSETLSAKRQAVYNVILNNGPICNQEIAELLDWPINRVTPRVHELRDLMRVQLYAKQIYKKTGKTVMFWEARP